MTQAVTSPIGLAEVLALQQAWGEGVLAIGRAHAQGGLAEATAVAEAFIDDLYLYSEGVVLFNPTLSSGDQTFRLNREGALSYFLGGHPSYPLDRGFALMGWHTFHIENAAVRLHGDVAMVMGKARFTGWNGQQVEVDKTWVFQRKAEGGLHIVLHHSALPYQPPAASA